MTFVKNEKNPKVTILSGRVSIFNIGLTKNSNMVKATPPIINVGNPPSILTPGKTWEIANMENALNNVFLKKDFMF